MHKVLGKCGTQKKIFVLNVGIQTVLVTIDLDCQNKQKESYRVGMTWRSVYDRMLFFWRKLCLLGLYISIAQLEVNSPNTVVPLPKRGLRQLQSSSISYVTLTYSCFWMENINYLTKLQAHFCSLTLKSFELSCPNFQWKQIIVNISFVL